MKKKIYLLLFPLLFVGKVFSQNTNSQNYFILPQVTNIPSSCLTTEKGKILYNTSDNKIYYCNGLTYTQINGISTNLYSLSDYSLSTYGKIKFSGIKGGVNKVLTAKDTTGTAEWQPLQGGSSGGFSYIGLSPSGSNRQNIPAATFTKVTVFQIQEFDDHNQFANSTFTAGDTAVYHFDIKANIIANVGSTQVYTVQIRKIVGSTSSNLRVTTHEAMYNYDFNTSLNVKLNKDDKIEVWVSAASSFQVSASIFSNFSGYRLY